MWLCDFKSLKLFILGGEDGSVKMWSKNGMLRSVLSQNGTPVYCISWSGDSSHILYCCGQNCFIKVLKVQVRSLN